MSLPIVLMLGLAASGVVAVIRAVVPQLWLLYKPFSCDLCMSWWASLSIVVAWGLSESVPPLGALLALFGSVGVSLLSVKAATRLSA